MGEHRDMKVEKSEGSGSSVCGVTARLPRSEQTVVRFRFDSAEATTLSRSSYPHLVNNPSFFSISSKTRSKIPCAHPRSTAGGYKTTLKKCTLYPRQVDRNTEKVSKESSLESFKHSEIGSQRKLTHSYPSADVSNVQARRMRSVALSTNRVICTSG